MSDSSAGSSAQLWDSDVESVRTWDDPEQGC